MYAAVHRGECGAAYDCHHMTSSRAPHSGHGAEEHGVFPSGFPSSSARFFFAMPPISLFFFEWGCSFCVIVYWKYIIRIFYFTVTQLRDCVNLGRNFALTLLNNLELSKLWGI